ncbi:MAG: ABC transporter substrate-binding protein [Methanobacteriota archaeon]|nr:MAG: ABC transporter substrate-binding protein [Euryarchaeota archaeon]
MPSPFGQVVLANKEEDKYMGGTIGPKAFVSAVSLFVVFAMVVSTFPAYVVGDDTRQDEEAILRIGAQDEPKTRNLLASGDVWTQNVLGPVYDSVTQLDPETEELKPYILKGTDLNENGVFDDSEYGQFGPLPSNSLEVVAFYDFNGFIFHDGYQATVQDVLFSYHMNANDPRSISLDVLKDKNNIGGNYTTSKWLWVNEVRDFDTVNGWDAAPPYADYNDPDYDTDLRAAVHFVQQVPYANFYRYTMSGGIYPQHIWEGTGCIYNEATETFNCDIHRKGDCSLMDFGYAYDPDTGNGNPGKPSLKEFDFGLAESWDLPDEYVIGTGPFEFDTWQKGAFSSLTKYDDFYEGEPYIHKPYIDGMLFKVYKTTQTAVFALKSGDSDYIAWSIPPDFVPDLLNDPNIGITSTAEKGFFYLSYNMRKVPFGYPDGDPANGDIGLNFRKAVAHLIDKKTIVTSLLQNYGIVADGPVSPSLARWYNSSLPTYGFNPAAADGLLDTYWPWDTTDGPCQSDGSGCRSFPGIGVEEIEILVPAADYDPIRAAAGNLIAQAMRANGLNARAVPTAFGQIIQDLDARDFQMFILGWRIGSDPPDYFHAFFYSRNAPAGQNYPGYMSDEFDDLIVQAREELDPTQQEFLIKWAQGVLANDRPYDVLYFRTNIEAYRSDRFTNWTVGAAGTIYSYWSWLGIHRPPPKPLRITTSIQSAVSMDRTGKFIATVRDPQGDVLEGATVTVYIDSTDLNNYRDGNLTYQTTTSNIITGTTDVNGQLKVTFLPPAVNKRRTVGIFAQATHPAYPESRNATIGIVVYPLGEQFLSLVVDLLGGDLVEEERPTLFRVEVQNQDEDPVANADVTITTVPPGAEITPKFGFTDASGFIEGVENVEFLAPRVDDDEDYRIEIRANLTNFEGTNRTFAITVANKVSPQAPLDLTLVFVGIGVIVAIVAVALIIAALRGGKSSRKRRIKKLKAEKLEKPDEPEIEVEETEIED